METQIEFNPEIEKLGITAEVIMLTPDIAQEMLKANKDNRSIYPTHVKFLIDQMKSEEWEVDGMPIRFSKNGRLLDGQHRLTAVLESGIAYPCLIVRGLKNESFVVMDTGKNRGGKDVISIEGFKNATQIAATCRQIIKLQARSQSRTRVSNTKLLNFVRENPDVYDHCTKQIKLYVDFGRILSLSIISGVSYLTEKKHAIKSQPFWEQLCGGYHLEENSPVALLRNILILDKGAIRRMGTTEKLGLILKAWNLYILDKDVKSLRFNPKTDKIQEIL